MKKSYRKPLVYCENHDTGVAVSNSEEYEQEMKRKLAEMGDIAAGNIAERECEESELQSRNAVREVHHRYLRAK